MRQFKNKLITLLWNNYCDTNQSFFKKSNLFCLVQSTIVGLFTIIHHSNYFPLLILEDILPTDCLSVSRWTPGRIVDKTVYKVIWALVTLLKYTEDHGVARFEEQVQKDTTNLTQRLNTCTIIHETHLHLSTNSESMQVIS